MPPAIATVLPNDVTRHAAAILALILTAAAGCAGTGGSSPPLRLPAEPEGEPAGDRAAPSPPGSGDSGEAVAAPSAPGGRDGGAEEDPAPGPLASEAGVSSTDGGEDGAAGSTTHGGKAGAGGEAAPPDAASGARGAGDGRRAEDPLRSAYDDWEPGAGDGDSGTSARARRGTRRAREIVENLLAGPPFDHEARRAIEDAPPEVVDALVARVDDPRPTHFYEIDTLAFHDDVVQIAEDEGRMFYFVKGMGQFYFDDVATSGPRGPQGIRVVFRNFKKPFSLGVVLRGALLKRVHSSEYPSFEDRDDIERWWRTYWQQNRPRR